MPGELRWSSPPMEWQHGLVFVGIDVIGDYLTEINVTSPTGVREIDAFSGSRLSEEVIAWGSDTARNRASSRPIAPTVPSEPPLLTHRQYY